MLLRHLHGVLGIIAMQDNLRSHVVQVSLMISDHFSPIIFLRSVYLHIRTLAWRSPRLYYFSLIEYSFFTTFSYLQVNLGLEGSHCFPVCGTHIYLGMRGFGNTSSLYGLNVQTIFSILCAICVSNCN